jgi:hypothetical protein
VEPPVARVPPAGDERSDQKSQNAVGQRSPVSKSDVLGAVGALRCLPALEVPSCPLGHFQRDSPCQQRTCFVRGNSPIAVGSWIG